MGITPSDNVYAKMGAHEEGHDNFLWDCYTGQTGQRNGTAVYVVFEPTKLASRMRPVLGRTLGSDKFSKFIIRGHERLSHDVGIGSASGRNTFVLLCY